MIEFSSKEEASEYFENQKLFFKDLDGKEVRVGDEIVLSWEPNGMPELVKGKIISIDIVKSVLTEDVRLRKIIIETFHKDWKKQVEYASSVDNSTTILKL